MGGGISQVPILGECLLISSLPGNALRMLVESRGLQFTSWFTLQTSDYDI